MGKTVPHSQEMRGRYQLAREWTRSPVTEAGENLLAERLTLEQRHAAERREWETRFARYLSQGVLPLERSKQKAAPPDQEHGTAFRVAS